MIIIGLTGGIGMGKSTVAQQLACLGVKASNSDQVVHRLLGKQGAAVASVGALFPETLSNSAIDRKLLGDIVFNDKAKLKQLEHILHPLVIEAEIDFIHRQQRLGAKYAVLDIPLLFETGAQTRCDMVLVASAPPFIQKQRVMQRPGMTEEKFRRILTAQMPDAEKRALADWIVPTGLGKAVTFRYLTGMMRNLHAA